MQSETSASPVPKRSRNVSPLYSAAPWVMFIAAAAAALGIFMLPGKLAEQQHRRLAERNQQLSLPADYPLDAAPMYPGIKVKAATKGDASSKDGMPMVQWDVTGSCNDEPKAVYEFYKNFCMEQDMLQTQMISIPTGYSLDYADDKQILHLEVEKPTSAKITSIRLTYYELSK